MMPPVSTITIDGDDTDIDTGNTSNDTDDNTGTDNDIDNTTNDTTDAKNSSDTDGTDDPNSRPDQSPAALFDLGSHGMALSGHLHATAYRIAPGLSAMTTLHPTRASGKKPFPLVSW
jgi:hypothetical protein